jgi:hypothetical protein
LTFVIEMRRLSRQSTKSEQASRNLASNAVATSSPESERSGHRTAGTSVKSNKTSRRRKSPSKIKRVLPSMAARVPPSPALPYEVENLDSSWSDASENTEHESKTEMEEFIRAIRFRRQ